MELPNLPEWLKVSTTHVVALGVAAAALLFLPGSVGQKIGVAEFVDAYRMWIGFVLIVCAAIVAARGIAAVFRWGQQRFGWWDSRRTGQARLRNLTPGEASILKHYLDNDTRTQYLSLEDGVARGLEAENVIFRSSNVSRSHTRFAFNIQPWAWDYLKKNPKIVASADSVTNSKDDGRITRSNF